MGFLSKAFKKNIMAPIGEPIDVLGTNPIFAKPKPFLPLKPTPRNLPLPPSLSLPPRGRPIPPISIGGIGGGKPINIGQPVPPPLQPTPILPDPRASKPKGIPIGNNVPGGGGINYGPDSLTPLPGSANEKGPIIPPPINLPPPRPLQPIDIPAPILPDPRASRPRGPIVGGNVPGGGGIDYGPGMGGGLIPPQDFGFGPGIRPTEIIGPNGEFIGSGGVTPPSGAIRTMDFQDTDMDGVDDRDQPNFDGPSQEYLDQKERMRQIFNPGITPQPDIGSDPIDEPVPTPVVDPVVTPTDQTDPTQTQMPMGAIDPVLLQQATSETLTDPLIRSLYFGTQDQPGFFQQLQQAGANLIGQDVPLQQTAGLTPLELLARQQAVAGIGGFEPFFQQNKDLIDQAIGQSRRAEALRDPYFQRAEQQMLLGLGDQLGGIDEARGITLGATDRFGRSLGRLGRQQIGATGQFGQRMGDIEADARGSTDIFGRNLDATQAGLTGQVDQFGQRLGNVEGLQAGATDQFGRRLSDVEARGEGAAGRFGATLGGIETGAIGSTDLFGRRLGESEDLIRGTLGGYDQGLTQQFYNPFEDAVVQQTIDDVLEAGDKQDIASRAREISSGAFGGSRARLGAQERREALGEGLAQALGRIRQQGFSEAQRTGLGEFARQKAAERSASQGLSGLAGTRFGAESGLFDRLTSGAQQRLAAEQGVVDLLGRTGQQQLGAQQALANLFQSTAGQRLGAGQSLAEFQRGTAGQQLASQQALQNLLQSSAGQQLGAQQQLGSTLRGLTGDQFGAQQQLASSLMGYGSAGAGARQNLASGLLGIGQQRGAGASALGQQLAGFGQQIGGIGSSLDALRRGQRGELAGFGSIGRGIAETGLGRIYQQQLGQQQRPLGVLGQIGSMLPGYQASRTQIDSQYGMPTDPSAAGLGAAFSAYGALAPRQGSS